MWPAPKKKSQKKVLLMYPKNRVSGHTRNAKKTKTGVDLRPEVIDSDTPLTRASRKEGGKIWKVESAKRRRLDFIEEHL